jgi:hypothetical protein
MCGMMKEKQRDDGEGGGKTMWQKSAGHLGLGLSRSAELQAPGTSHSDWAGAVIVSLDSMQVDRAQLHVPTIDLILSDSTVDLRTELEVLSALTVGIFNIPRAATRLRSTSSHHRPSSTAHCSHGPLRHAGRPSYELDQATIEVQHSRWHQRSSSHPRQCKSNEVTTQCVE